MRTFHARVSKVDDYTYGDELVADAAIGATSLFVDDAADYDEQLGGWIRIGGDGGELIRYTTVDDDTGEISLATTLITAAVTGDRVDLWDPVKSAPVFDRLVYAYPDGMTDGDPLEATARHDMVTLLPIGDRPDDEGESVLVEEDDEAEDGIDPDLLVVHVYGSTPLLDGGFIDTDTLPEGGPVELPVISPTPTAKVGPAAAILDWVPTVGLRYEVHVADVNTTAPDATTLAFDAAGPPTWIYTLADGATKLSTEIDSYAALVAYNSAGAQAPASPWVPIRAGVIPPENITALFGEVLAQSMNTDEFRAETITSPSLDVAGILLNAVVGLFVPSTTPGKPRLQVPLDPAAAIQLLAHIEALSALFQGNVTIRGLTNFLHGLLTLGNGTSDPSSPPGVSWDWDSLTTDAHTAAATFGNDLWHGLTSDGGTNWVTAEDFIGVGKLIRYSASTGAIVASTTLAAGFQPTGGVVRIGTNFYVLGHDANRSDDWYVYRYDSSYVKTGEAKVISATGCAGVPAIGGDSNDATRLLVAFTHKATTTVRVRDYLLTEFATMPNSASATINAENSFASGTVYNIGGVRRATFDGLTNGLMIATQGSTMYVYNSAGVRQTSLERPRANGAKAMGLSWDGTRWRTFSGDGIVWIYSLHDGASRAYGYTWYDGDAGGAGVAESKLSPTLTRTVPRGARPNISTPAPDDDGTADAPDRVRVYADNHLQATYTASPLELSRAFDSLNMGGAASPVTSGFATRPATAPGALASSKTDGSGALALVRGDGAHRFAGVNLDDTGWQTFTVTAGGTGFSNTTVTYAEYRRIGRLVQIRLSKASNAAINNGGNTTGDFTNVNVCSLAGGSFPAALLPTRQAQMMARFADAPTTAIVQTTGDIVRVGGYPTNYASGSDFIAEAWWFLDPVT